MQRLLKRNPTRRDRFLDALYLMCLLHPKQMLVPKQALLFSRQVLQPKNSFSVSLNRQHPTSISHQRILILLIVRTQYLGERRGLERASEGRELIWETPECLIVLRKLKRGPMQSLERLPYRGRDTQMKKSLGSDRAAVAIRRILQRRPYRS